MGLLKRGVCGGRTDPTGDAAGKRFAKGGRQGRAPPRSRLGSIPQGELGVPVHTPGHQPGRTGTECEGQPHGGEGTGPSHPGHRAAWQATSRGLLGTTLTPGPALSRPAGSSCRRPQAVRRAEGLERGRCCSPGTRVPRYGHRKRMAESPARSPYPQLPSTAQRCNCGRHLRSEPSVVAHGPCLQGEPLRLLSWPRPHLRAHLSLPCSPSGVRGWRQTRPL